MIANVMKTPDGRLTRGYVSAGPGSDTYVFALERGSKVALVRYSLRWDYKGKSVGESFIPADVQGYEHIPQEFYAALDQACHAPNGFFEFPDPFLDSLEVAGT